MINIALCIQKILRSNRREHFIILVHHRYDKETTFFNLSMHTTIKFSQRWARKTGGTSISYMCLVLKGCNYTISGLRLRLIPDTSVHLSA